ncbi:sensor histidine kinase KdpD [Spirosoma sp. 209]|uniref:sensor histidine kinase n=1 Tax=Spirosoma sp. 209 TaxID=1955701 RepID=UPI0011164364|nr:HAMP domain-containing sensor histidine kinase [Spirosoma sp. 209]
MQNQLNQAMPWPFRLPRRMLLNGNFSSLSPVDQLRLITLLHIGWYGMVLLVLIVSVSMANGQYDRAQYNLIAVPAFLVPTLWLAYKHKVQLASWYLLIAMYATTIWGIYVRLLDKADVHVELLFIMIGIFSIILINSRASLALCTLLAISYLTARIITFQQLHLHFEMGQLITGMATFIALTYVSYTVKKTAMQIQRTIAVQNQALSELNTMKDNLFAIIGHDLRSPVAGLKTQLMAVKAGYTSAGQFEQRIDQLAQSVDGVYLTLDNLLHWAMLQRERIKPNPISLDLSKIAEPILLLYVSDIQRKQLTVTTHLDTAPAAVDEHQLSIVVRNLIHNAIKFTPQGGTIRLSTSSDKGQARLTVQDSGIGMPVANQTESRESAVQNRGTSGERGTGLGLQICREFMRLNQGTLHIQSEPGKGSTITISFMLDKSKKSANRSNSITKLDPVEST